MSISTQHEVRGTCPHDCPDTCALLIGVRDGRAVSIKGDSAHPPTAGVLCTKVSRYLERTYHPDRLLYPHKRVGRKGEGRFVRISWDEALDTIATRLQEIAARDAQAVVPYSYAGTMGLVQGDGMAQRFFHKLGASLLDRTICATAGGTGYRYTVGARIGTDLEQVQHARLIVIWGGNPVTSNLHFWMRAQEAKRQGARIIVVDPYRSLTAEKAHWHIAPLPGTDAALALGLMRVLVDEQWIDHDYIERYTQGFSALKTRLQDWPVERAAHICGLAAETIVAFAREYGQIARTGAPVMIRLNYGVQRTAGGGMAVRNIACLPALVGAWRHPAGGIQLSVSDAFPKHLAALQRPDLLPPGAQPRTINMSTIGNALLDPGSEGFGPKIEALVVYNSNPVAVAPESAKVAAGFAREDLFTVVLEHFQTDTADYADLLLPATTQLEHADVHSAYGHLYMMANNPAIAPLGECKSNSEIFRLLAARMGWSEACFQESDDDMAAQAFKNTHPHAVRFDWPSLKREGWRKLDTPVAPFAEGGFPTPSGRCEFFSAQMQTDGYDPLPTFHPPYESHLSDSEQVRRFPLALISPPARNFLNSTFVNVDSLRATEREPHLELHPEDAAQRGLSDGQWLRVSNDRGAFQARLRVTDKVRPGTAVALSLWWKKLTPDGQNANAVTSQRLTDMGRGPTFYDVLVEVQACAEPDIQAQTHSARGRVC